MYESQAIVNFIDKVFGVTKNGEQYVSVSVIPVEGTQKLSFMSTDPDVLNVIKSMDIKRFDEIILRLGFKRIFNPENRTSYWSCELLGIG